MKKQKYILGVLVFLIIFGTTVKASTFEMQASPNEIVASEGETVQVNLSIEKIDMNEKGVNTVEGFIKYDESIIESLELINQNDWKVTYNQDEESDLYGKFLSVKEVDGIKDDENVLLIKVKLKDNIEKESGNIVIEEITSNDGEKLVNIGNKIIKIEIKKEADKSNDTSDDKGGNTINDSNNNATEENSKISDEAEGNVNKKSEEKNDIEKNAKEESKKQANNLRTGDIIPSAVISTIAIIIILNALISIRRKRRE